MTKMISRVCLGAAALTLALAACASTGGVPIALELAFEPASPPRFTTVSGWDVELDEASVVLAALYALDEPDAMALLAPSRAFAHGGHAPLDGSVVRAELLGPRVVDALASSEPLALDGLAGVVRTATIVLAPSTDLDRSVYVQGVARRGADEVRFEGGLVLTDAHRIEDVAVEGEPLDEGARLVVELDARAWLAEADFAELAASGTSRIEGTQPERALWLAARSAGSWRARIEGGGR